MSGSAGGWLWLAVIAAAGAAALALPARARWPLDPVVTVSPPASPNGLLHRWRGVWSLLAGVAGQTFVGGWPGAVAAVLLAGGCWWLIGRSEPTGVRRTREQATRQLPLLVDLFALGLGAGAAPASALTMACTALPGPASDRLAGVRARLELGVDPGPVWASLAGDPALAALGRAMTRAHDSGAPVSALVARLADELAQSQRATAQERARSVGVRAAVPLGLCLLPAFLVLGVVPVVAGLLSSLGL